MVPGITICLLAYKEAENLKVLIPQIADVLNKIRGPYEILVVDSKKPLDNTSEVCAEFGARYVNQVLPGYGGAFRTGVIFAQYDKILYLDSDLSHNPKNIADIYNMYTTGGYDVVIGSRYVDGGMSNDSKVSFLMSKVLNTAFRFVLDIQANDISTSYRIYSTAALREIELTKANYDILQEVLLRLGIHYNRALNIGETPIHFEKRLYGESKRQLFTFIANYAVNLVEFTLIKYPLLRNTLLYVLFGVLGLAVDFSTFSLLLNVFNEEISNVLGAGFGFAFTFTANTFLNFKKNDRLVLRFFSYLAICLVGVAVSTGLISVLKHMMDVHVAKILAMSVSFFIQFTFNKTVTYKKIQ
jgi:dolichol-phosphate mannosyltransferase